LRIRYSKPTNQARIAVVSENRPEYVELLFGIWAAGMIATPINAKLHPREMIEIFEDASVSAGFVSEKIAPALDTALAETSLKCDLFRVGAREYDALLGRELDAPVEAAPETLAWLFFTSGTTGRSKGAMLSHRNLLAMTIAHLADIDAVDQTMSLVHSAPMSHGSGLYILPYLARAPGAPVRRADVGALIFRAGNDHLRANDRRQTDRRARAGASPSTPPVAARSPARARASRLALATVASSGAPAASAAGLMA
jgi:acyl-CoA synthetase (AMP-forming)/AMP-acid ligase II